MGHLFLVRHGQASLGAQDYDNLSELGQRQSLRLGQYLAAKGLAFDAVLTGTLRRHAQTWEHIVQGASYSNEALLWPGLNEYDAQAVIRAVHPQASDKIDTPQAYRTHFSWLRQGLLQWMRGEVQPLGMPPYTEFLEGVASALDHIRQSYTGNVLIVSSGGPIATAVGHVLGSGVESIVELNMRLRNSAITEFTFSPKRHALLSYNHLPHLDATQYAQWVTYA